jgi:tetratricopeptide (TPR) repeat protein
MKASRVWAVVSAGAVVMTCAWLAPMPVAAASQQAGPQGNPSNAAPKAARKAAVQAAKAGAGAPEPDLCVVPPGAQPLLPAHLLEGQGVTDMPVTTSSAEARKFFNQGVSQLHSFWIIEAERSFLQAATLDPDMAMAYWGIAMSAAADHRPAFQLIRDTNDGGRTSGAAGAAGAGGGDVTAIARTTNGAAIDGVVRSREAIAKAMALRDKVTPRERLYIEAEAARRNVAAAPKAQDADYIAGMRKVVEAYPDDLEAKTILGLALLDGFDPVTKEPRAHTLEGIALLEAVVVKDDNAFGAHHYLIHGYEGSRTPEKAWRACERYPQLVTNIPHALHMPGHIYAQSDRIPDAVAAFTEAATNELGYLNADVLYPNGHHGHNVHFLIHALNLDGRYRESMLQARQLLAFKETPRERQGVNQRVTWRQGYYSLVKTLVRFERWDEVLDGRTIPSYDKPEQRAWRAWAEGLAYSATGRPDQAKTALKALQQAISEAPASSQPIRIAAIELDATITARGGDRPAGYALFRRAADREAALTYTEPPSYPRPVVEAWGNVALALGDYAAAESAYREALTREPGSARAWFGQAAAVDALGRPGDAKTLRDRAARAWERADRDLPQWKQITATASASADLRP